MGSKSVKFVMLAAGLALSAGALAGSHGGQKMANGEMLSGTCFACHGPGGVSTGPSIPSIGGLPEEFLVDKMMAYKEGSQYATIMGRIMRGYTKGEIESMAKYIGNQRYRPTPQKVDVNLVALGAKLHEKNCEKCHEDNGRSGEEAGVLSGQWAPYLHYVMADYRSGRSEMPKKMKRKVEKLSDADIDALIDFYASQH